MREIKYHRCKKCYLVVGFNRFFQILSIGLAHADIFTDLILSCSRHDCILTKTLFWLYLSQYDSRYQNHSRLYVCFLRLRSKCTLTRAPHTKLTLLPIQSWQNEAHLHCSYTFSKDQLRRSARYSSSESCEGMDVQDS